MTASFLKKQNKKNKKKTRSKHIKGQTERLWQNTTRHFRNKPLFQATRQHLNNNLT